MSSSDINSNNEVIANFNPNYEDWTTGAGIEYHINDLEGTPRLRAGDSGLQITAAPSTSVTSTYDGVLPIDYISSGDKIKVAFHVSGSVPSSVELKMYSDQSNYFTATIPAASISAGYNIKTLDFDDLVATGTLDTNSISSMSVKVTAATSQSIVTMDAIRFDKYSDVSKPVLISHSLLSAPLVVEGGNKFDIEYRLGFDI